MATGTLNVATSTIFQTLYSWSFKEIVTKICNLEILDLLTYWIHKLKLFKKSFCQSVTISNKCGDNEVPVATFVAKVFLTLDTAGVDMWSLFGVGC